MRRTLWIAVLLVALTAVPVYAQRGGFAGRGYAPRSSMGVHSGVIVRGGFGFGHNPRFGVFFNNRRFHHRRFFYPYAFFGFGYYGYPYAMYPYTIYPYYPYGLQSDFVYSDLGAQPEYNAGQNAVVQSDVQRLQAEVDELRQEQAAQRQQAAEAQRWQYAPQSPVQPRQPAAAPPARQAPPTVLVFKDGRREEVKNYAIAGKTLWIFSEERARKMPVSDLDLDATRKVNEERGVEFVK